MSGCLPEAEDGGWVRNYRPVTCGALQKERRSRIDLRIEPASPSVSERQRPGPAVAGEHQPCWPGLLLLGLSSEMSRRQRREEMQ